MMALLKLVFCVVCVSLYITLSEGFQLRNTFAFATQRPIFPKLWPQQQPATSGITDYHGYGNSAGLAHGNGNSAGLAHGNGNSAGLAHGNGNSAGLAHGNGNSAGLAHGNGNSAGLAHGNGNSAGLAHGNGNSAGLAHGSGNSAGLGGQVQSSSTQDRSIAHGVTPQDPTESPTLTTIQGRQLIRAPPKKKCPAGQRLVGSNCRNVMR